MYLLPLTKERKLRIASKNNLPLLVKSVYLKLLELETKKYNFSGLFLGAIRIARKEHVCAICDEKISTGEKHLSLEGVVMKDFYKKVHQTCIGLWE